MIMSCGKSNRELAAGLPETLNELVLKNMGLVHELARGIKRGPRTGYEDLVQEGVVAIIEAAAKFNPSLGFEFCTYAGTVARRRMVKFASNYRSAITVPCFDAEAHPKLAEKRKTAYSVQPLHREKREADGEWTVQVADRKERDPADARVDCRALVEIAMRRKVILARERDVILMRARGWTLDDVGGVLHISKERVRQIEQKAIAKLARMAEHCKSHPVKRTTRPLQELVAAVVQSPRKRKPKPVDRQSRLFY